MADNIKKKKKTPTGKIILFAVEIVALIALLIIMWVVTKVTDEEEGVQKKDMKLTEEQIELETPDEVKQNEVMKGYQNIALFGVDSRDGDLAEKTRSDTIIIASINNETKEVKLVSVYRDTYLYILSEDRDIDYSKCNAAYAYGGADRAIRMLNLNLDLQITDFVTIGFEGLRDVIDALGGVYLDVDSDELMHINNYQISMDPDNYVEVKSTGYQLLDGLQATAYCRIRYTSGGDFKRTERQREVIKAIFETAKTSTNPAALAQICNNVFSEVYTSFDIQEVLTLLTHITEYSIVDEGGFPEASHRTVASIGSRGSCVVPIDLSWNVSYLHKFLFGEDNYKPSSKVLEYSETIKQNVKDYVTMNMDVSDDFGDD